MFVILFLVYSRERVVEMERILSLQGGYNFRELGGYETKNGLKVKNNRLLRASALENLTEEDLIYLHKYGVDTVIDFRTKQEQLMAPDKKIPEANYFVLPVFKEDETQNTITPTDLYAKILAGESGEKKMEAAYADFVLTQQAQKTYQTFFHHLITEEKTLIFHCTAGKDRTGFGAYLFLSALGIPEEVIYEDYLLTNPASEEKVDHMLKEARKQNAPEELVKNILDLLLAKKSYLDTAVDAIEKNYGNVEGFLKDGLNLSKGDLKDLKSHYLM